MISLAIRCANLPTLVPPYFCTTHLVDGSTGFWWRFGGVLGGERDANESAAEDLVGEGVVVREDEGDEAMMLIYR